MSRPLCMLFGDSLTASGATLGEHGPGWVALLTNALMYKADLVNRGFSGYTTRMALQLIDTGYIELPREPDVTLVWFGANDAASNERQHVPVDEYRSNLERICQHFSPSRVVLLTPPPVHEELWAQHRLAKYGDGTSDRSNAQVVAYVEAVESLGQDLGIPVINVWRALMAPGYDLASLLRDGLHFTAQGQRMVFERVVDALQAHFPHTAPATARIAYPEQLPSDAAQARKRLLIYADAQDQRSSGVQDD